MNFLRRLWRQYRCKHEWVSVAILDRLSRLNPVKLETCKWCCKYRETLINLNCRCTLKVFDEE